MEVYPEMPNQLITAATHNGNFHQIIETALSTHIGYVPMLERAVLALLEENVKFQKQLLAFVIGRKNTGQ